VKRKLVIKLAILLVIAVLIGSCASGGGGGKTEKKAAPPKYSWNFDNAEAGTAGWVLIPDEYWDFHGTAVLSRDDKTFGKPMLRMDVDYSKDADSEWSEPKMKVQLDKPVEGARKFTFDFIYNPSLSKSGHFKSKIIIFNGKKELAANNSDAILAIDELPNGYVKGTVSLIAASSAPVDNIILSIAGYKTNYKGPVFFDNMRME